MPSGTRSRCGTSNIRAGGNRGCPASRNPGIRHARGEYLAFLNAGDVWLPAKLATQVALLRAHPGAAMTYGPSQWWYSWMGAPDDAGRDYTQDLGIPPFATSRYWATSPGP